MSELSLTKKGLRQGVWEGILTRTGGSGLPEIRAEFLSEPVPGVELRDLPGGDGWLLRIPVPENAIADGVQTIVIAEGAQGEKIGDFTLIAGEALSDEIRAEVELLRAELDMLKRAFRRHCLETM